MSWVLRLRKTIDEARTGGPGGALRYIRKRLARRNKYFVFEIDLRNNIPEKENESEISIRRISVTTEDIDKVVRFWVENYKDTHPLYYNEKLVRSLVRRRLKNGELCFVAEANGKIVHFNWIGLFKNMGIYREEPVRFLKIDRSKYAYSYNIYTRPEFRGMGIMASTLFFIEKYLKKIGYEKIISCVGEKNIASIKVHEKMAVHTENIYVTRYLIFEKFNVERA